MIPEPSMVSRSINWQTWEGLSPYGETVLAMEKRVHHIAKGEQEESIWLLEHPPVYTAGSSLDASGEATPLEDIKADLPFPLEQSNRGGRVTYHGPGQRIIYVMLNLVFYKRDVRRFVYLLEQWMIDALACWGVRGERNPAFPGVWIREGGALKKIAALGIRIRAGVSFHGIGLNVSVDLSHYDPIIPCGVEGGGICRLNDLVAPVSMKQVDKILAQTFHPVLG